MTMKPKDVRITGLIVIILFLTMEVCAQEAEKVSAASVVEITLNEFGTGAAIIKFREMHAQKEYYSVSQSDLLRLGGNLRREGKNQEAIAVLNMIVEAFPNSDQAYLELGRAYRSLGLRESIEINRAQVASFYQDKS